jgi:multiple sugar transport system substrate-binding protein
MDRDIHRDNTAGSDITARRRRLMKQLSLGAIVGGSGMLAGCSTDSDGTPTEDGDDDQGTDGDTPTNQDSIPFPRDDDAFSGTTLDVVYDAGTGPLVDLYGYLIEDDVGVSFSTQTLPYKQLYEKVNAGFLAGQPAGDIVTYPPIFLGDYNSRDLFEPLDSYLAKYKGSDQYVEEVLDPFWEFYCKWDGNVVGLPIDGDIYTFNYRPSYFEDEYHQEQFKDQTGKDLKVPDTWPYYNEVANYFTENTDDDNVYGTVVHGKRPWCWSFWMNRAASNGVLYFDENMEPMVDSPEAVEALENMVGAVEAGPDGTGSFDSGQVINAWQQGNAVMSQWWVNITQVSPDAPIAGDQAIEVMPGWEQDDGSIRRNSTIAYSRVMSVPAGLDDKTQEAAFYAAYRFTNTPISTHAVTNAHTGLEPYMESSHYTDESKKMLTTGDEMMDPDRKTEGSSISFDSLDMAEEFFEGQRKNLAVGFPQPNWPGSQQYMETMGIHVQRALTGQSSAEKALSNMADEMRSIRDDLGREEQEKHYQNFLDTAKKFGYV